MVCLADTTDWPCNGETTELARDVMAGKRRRKERPSRSQADQDRVRPHLLARGRLDPDRDPSTDRRQDQERHRVDHHRRMVRVGANGAGGYHSGQLAPRGRDRHRRRPVDGSLRRDSARHRAASANRTARLEAPLGPSIAPGTTGGRNLEPEVKQMAKKSRGRSSRIEPDDRPETPVDIEISGDAEVICATDQRRRRACQSTPIEICTVFQFSTGQPTILATGSDAPLQASEAR